jgi:hypothetical protein
VQPNGKTKQPSGDHKNLSFYNSILLTKQNCLCSCIDHPLPST